MFFCHYESWVIYRFPICYCVIQVWDLDTLECLMTLNGHTGEVTSLICWSDFLLSGASDCTIKIWVATEEGPLKVTYTHTLENVSYLTTINNICA